MTTGSGFLFASAAIMLATGAPAIAQDNVSPAAQNGTVLDLDVEGSVDRAPDQVTISGGVVTQGSSAAEAMSANAKVMATVIGALGKAGVDKRDIRTASLSLSPRMRQGDHQPSTIAGYEASNRVMVRLDRVEDAGKVVDAMVSAGANQIDGPDFGIANMDMVRDAARSDAIAKAKTRADLYAKATGMRVARILSIDESGSGSGGPAPMLRTMKVAAPTTPVEPGEQQVTVTLDVRFLLQ